MSIPYESIAAAFDEYQRTVLPPGASPVQVMECQRAFYAAAYGMMATLVHAWSVDESTPQTLQARLDAMTAEVKAYVAAQTDAEVARVLAAEQSSYNVRHDGAESAMRECLPMIRGAMPDGFGFALLIFSFGDGGSMFYGANADRSDVVAAMREFIARQTQ